MPPYCRRKLLQQLQLFSCRFTGSSKATRYTSQILSRSTLVWNNGPMDLSAANCCCMSFLINSNIVYFLGETYVSRVLFYGSTWLPVLLLILRTSYQVASRQVGRVAHKRSLADLPTPRFPFVSLGIVRLFLRGSFLFLRLFRAVDCAV